LLCISIISIENKKLILCILCLFYPIFVAPEAGGMREQRGGCAEPREVLT